MDPIIPQPEQLPAQPPKHFLNKKFIVTFVVLILLGISAYAGIWMWQKQQVAQEVAPTFTSRADGSTSLTTSWKTYTNTKYEFEFKYPSNLSVKESVDQYVSSRFGVTLDLHTASDSVEDAYIFFESTGNIFDPALGYGSFGSASFYTNIGGVDWVAKNIEDCAPGPDNCAPHNPLFIVRRYQGNFYTITLYPNDDTKIDSKFVSILNTFQFIKSGSLSSPKTVDFGNFIIDIPGDWDILQGEGGPIFISPERTRQLKDPNYHGPSGDIRVEYSSMIKKANSGTLNNFVLGNYVFDYYQTGTTDKVDHYETQRPYKKYFSSITQQDLTKKILSTFKFTK